MSTNKPQIFITMGDPSGIGPEIIMKSMASPDIKGLAIFTVIGDAGVIEQAAGSTYDDEIAFHKFPVSGEEEIVLRERVLNVVDPGGELPDIKSGIPTKEGARKALECLDAAVKLMRTLPDDSPKALVTAPLSKEMISDISPGFIGHTEHLQKAYSADLVTMVLTGEILNVIPVTRHIPLKDAASKLNAKLIEKTLVQVIENRVLICGKKDARIGVCGLNPHCGEGGKIGREERNIIIPAISKVKNIYENIEGPIPADVIFYQAVKKEWDIIVCMYHDQGLSPFKMMEFDKGVNMTLGLGHIRTSPDHGTAFDIAGKGIASHESMKQAIKLAIRALKMG